jgi:hypothetical protein
MGFWLPLIFTFLISTQASITAKGFSYSIFSDSVISNLINTTYKNLNHYTLDSSTKTQTMAYLSRNGLKNNLNSKYNDDIKRIGKPFFKQLFSSVLSKELEFQDTYRVFYHGQDRNFMLFQDIYKGLYEIAYKKCLKDFIILRIPHKEFGKHKNATDFLHHCIKNGDITKWDFDHLYRIKKQLLSVNASLFGNTCYLELGECTFHYFISSSNVSIIDISDLIKQTFEKFNYSEYYIKYLDHIDTLQKLLSAYEDEKTGALLQIFIPEKLVNSLCYRSKPFGLFYYNDLHPENHPATLDLDNYKNDLGWTDNVIDRTQFRLLINNSLLNPDSGIKFYRYCNETKNIKQYQKKLNHVLKKIKADISYSKAKDLYHFKPHAMAFA